MEASDADNLLEQFEEVSPDFDDDYSQNSSISGHFSTTTSSNNVQNGAGNGNSKNPRKTSNIFKAVQNHFAASVAANNESNSANGRCRRLPRIGKPTYYILHPNPLYNGVKFFLKIFFVVIHYLCLFHFILVI